jgi:hypothetical protein
MGGSEGNAHLTAAIAAVLLVLLAGEGATIPMIRQALTWHVFIGLLLVPPILLKLTSTGWRFVRYYRGTADYVAKGPPHPFLRFLVAPVVTVSTITLFGTGIALVVAHPHGGLMLGLHKASFVIWFGAMSLHVLAHIRTVLHYLHAGFARALPGRSLRQGLVMAALVSGVIVGLAYLPSAHAWTHWAALQHGQDR